MNTADPFLIHHLAFVLTRQSDQILQEQLGIGLSQFRILNGIDNSQGILQRDIAEALYQTEAGISRQIKLLIEKDYARTTVNPKDRRQHVTEITFKGHKVLEAAREVFGKMYRDLEKSLGDKQVNDLLKYSQYLHVAVCPKGQNCSFLTV